MCMPDKHYRKIKDQWQNQLKGDSKFECAETSSFLGAVCASYSTCDRYYDKLDSVEFQLDDTVFTLGPEAYLLDINAVNPQTKLPMSICWFAITPIPNL